MMKRSMGSALYKGPADDDISRRNMDQLYGGVDDFNLGGGNALTLATTD